MTIPAQAGAAYGWRARIGFLQPAVANPNHPHEFYLVAPPGVTISIASLGSVEDPPASEFLSEESLKRATERVPLGAKALAAQGVHVIVQAGIPHLSVYGRGIEDRLRAQVAEVTDIPLVMDMRSSALAMQRLGMTRVVMASPFTEKLSAGVADYLRPEGIDIVSTYRVNVGSYGGLFGISLGTVYDEAKRAFQAAGNVDGVWLPGAAMPTVAVVEALEQDLGVPVVSSKQAMLWAALRTARVSEPVLGYGSLFRQ